MPGSPQLARRVGRALASAGAAALVLVWLPVAPFAGTAAAADPAHVSVTLEGCDVDAGASVPDATGAVRCDDPDYERGNLGKNWNELDLVPFRVVAEAGHQAPDPQTYTVAVALDGADGGHVGFDVLSAPVLDRVRSDPTCTDPTVTDTRVLSPGLGGVDRTLYRLVTVTQPADSTCVLDYYGRLAVGAHDFPGASLHANLLSEQLTTQGIGARDVSVPTREVDPQGLAKTMTATQGAGHGWTVTQQADPAALDVGTTCDPQQPHEAATTLRVDWTRAAPGPAGDITLTTRVTATNPAHRPLHVDVTDRVYEGAGDASPVGTDTAAGEVPGNGARVFTFTRTVPQGSGTHFHDVATASYTDPVTGVAVAGTTSATASADVQLTGQAGAGAATLTEVLSVTPPFEMRVDAVSPSGGSLGGYTLGTSTAGPLTWTSPTLTGSGSATFDVTVSAPDATRADGTLDAAAALSPSGAVSAQEVASSVAVAAAAADPTLTVTKRLDVAPLDDATFRFDVVDDADGSTVGLVTVVVPAGETSRTSAPVTVPPSAAGYTLRETAAAGYTGVDTEVPALGLCDSHAVTVDNTRDLTEPTTEPTTPPSPEPTTEPTTSPSPEPTTSPAPEPTTPAGPDGGTTPVPGGVPTADAPADTRDTTGSAALPRTGAEVPFGPLAAVALLLVGVGVALLQAVRPGAGERTW